MKLSFGVKIVKQGQQNRVRPLLQHAKTLPALPASPYFGVKSLKSFHAGSVFRK